MSEIISATNAIIAEDFDPSQDLNEPRIVSRELNFDFGQFFYPQEKRKIFEIRCFRRIADDQQINAIIKPDAILGTLTTFDERVFYALIEIWQEQEKADVCLFSEREIARRIKVQWGRQSAKAIRDSLTRLCGVSIDWQGSFYDSVKGGLVEIHNPFSILSHLEITSTKTQHFRDQRAEFSFNARVIKNLNSNHSRPVRFDVILSFHCPLAQAMYTFSEPKLYGTKEYHRRTKKLVGDLGLIAKSWQHRGTRVREFGKLQKELIGKPTGFGEVIESYEIVSGKDDAVMVMTRSGAAGRIKGKKVKGSRAECSEATQKPQKSRQEPKKTQAKETPTPTPKKPTEAKSDACKVLELFDKTFDGGGRHSESDVVKAEAIIKEHGLQVAEYLVRFAGNEAPKTNYKPKFFSGIVKYKAAALKEWKSTQKRQERQAQKIAETRLKNARYDHEKAYTVDYYEYVNELVCSLGDEYPSRFNEFRGWQAEQRREKENLEGNLREVSLRVFDSEGQSILRLTQFFQDDPDIHIPDFWQWDCQENPHRFTTEGEGGTFPKKSVSARLE